MKGKIFILHHSYKVTLEEKQQYYEFRGDYFVRRTPPVLMPGTNEALLKMGGVDQFGDQLWRIVWDDTELKDGYIYQDDGTTKPGRVLKYPFVKARRPKYHCYRNEKHQICRVARQDQLPKDAGFVWIEYETIQRGRLRWQFECKLTLEQLIYGNYYPDPESEAGKKYGIDDKYQRYASIPSVRGEYVGMFPLVTPNGSYFEPTHDWLEYIRRTHYEDKNKTSAQIADEQLAEMLRMDEVLAAQEDEAADALVDRLIVAAEKAPVGRVMAKPLIENLNK